MRFPAYILAALVAGSFGCGSDTPEEDETDPETNCVGAKCDTPDDDPDYAVADICKDRQAELLQANRKIFLEDAIRWSCADVRGVNTNNEDSRGQEYCEYWAGLRSPPETETADYGEPVTIGRPLSDEGGEVTPLSLDLNEGQIFYLEDHISDVMGSCYFTTWHNDFDFPYPACADDSECAETRDGLPLTADIFRMKVFFNGNSAAYELVRDCLGAVVSDEYDKGEPGADDNELESDFIRGCHLADTAFGFSWRKSDSSICAATMRLGECGCIADPDAAASALVPPPGTGEMRGFPLGGWAADDRLPTGCEYVETGDDSQTLVRCDLTGGDVLQGQTDLKGYCRQKYGDNVVAYVPVPSESIACEPPDGGAYADTCSETPWVITQ